MSATDKIVGELQAAVAGLGESRGHIEKATHHCDRVATRMAGAGFLGVAQGMSQVKDMLGKIQARIHSAAGEVGQAVVPIGQITKQMSAEQVTGRLAACKERTAAARTSTAGTAEDCVQAAHTATAVLRGGQPGPLLSMIEAARTNLLHVIGRIDAARQHTDEATTVARQAGEEHAGN